MAVAIDEKGISETEEAKIMERFDRDSKWLAKNYEKLRTEYLEKFIAVKDNKVIAESESIQGLHKKLEEKGVDSRTILVDFMLSKDAVLFL